MIRPRSFMRYAVRLLVTVAGVTFGVVRLGAQSVQYRSPAGVAYRAQADTGPIARARAALTAEPRDVQRIIALGVAQSGARQFREAIATFSRGLTIAPNNAMLYRWRGHRYISIRQFDNALADLRRGYQLDSTNYGILFHLGVLRFAKRDFAGAATMFAKAQPLAPDGGERAGSTDWLWMSLSRANRPAEAAAMLARRADTLPAPPGYAYVSRLRLYRGETAPEALVTASDTFALLRRSALTIWLRATPEDHWNRVLRQGDRRPSCRRSVQQRWNRCPCRWSRGRRQERTRNHRAAVPRGD